MIRPHELRMRAKEGKALAALLAHNPSHRPAPDLIDALSDRLREAADEIDQLNMERLAAGTRRAA